MGLKLPYTQHLRDARLRAVVVVVLLSVVLLGGWATRRRWRGYRQQAAFHQRQEQVLRGLAATARQLAAWKAEDARRLAEQAKSEKDLAEASRIRDRTAGAEASAAEFHAIEVRQNLEADWHARMHDAFLRRW